MRIFDNIGVGGSVSDKQADTKGTKIDTSANSEKEQETQDKVEDAMENDEEISDNDIDANTSSEDDDEDSEEESDEDDDESSEDEEEDEDEEESESEDDSKEESKEDEEVEKPTEEAHKEVYDTEVLSKLAEIEKYDSLTEEAVEQKVMTAFLDLHKDTLPESARLNFKKFVDSGRNNAFLMADDSLYKLVMTVRDFNPDLPLSERLTKAHKIVFANKIAVQEQKKGQVKAEVKAQIVNKSVSNNTKTSSKKSSKGDLSSDQKRAFEKMGVPLKDYKKYGKN